VKRSVARTLVLSAALTGLALAVGATPLPDPTPGSWQQLERLGGTAVRGAQAFSIADVAYVVSGMTDRSIPHHEVWLYTADGNAWTRMNDFSGTGQRRRRVLDRRGGLRLRRQRKCESRQGL